MDTFFRRHFRRKVREPGARRRSSVAVPTSKARRRSSVGLPSVGLAQRRRSSVQIQAALLAAGGHSGGPLVRDLVRGRRFARRRSSGATACLTPRFSLRRRRAAKHRSIHAQLLGPSLLLASVVQMSEEREGGEGEDSEGGQSSSPSDEGSQSDGSWEDPDEPAADPNVEADPSPSWLAESLVGDSLQPRPIIRAPRCLRRNSSHLLPAEAVYRSPGYYGLYGRYRRNSQVWRTANAGLGRVRGGRRSSRKGSLTNYWKFSTLWPEAGLAGVLQGTYYNPQTDTWNGFLSYVQLKYCCVCVCACVKAARLLLWPTLLWSVFFCKMAAA